jgi:hypothetical protein
LPRIWTKSASSSAPSSRNEVLDRKKYTAMRDGVVNNPTVSMDILDTISAINLTGRGKR